MSTISVGMIVLTATVGLVAASQQRPTVKSAPPSAPVIPRLADRAVSEIQESAKGRSLGDFSGLSDYSDGIQRLYITSYRASIAFMTVKAAQSNGRYVPPASEREDSVIIKCGQHEIGKIFECSRVRVISRDKKVIKPTFYSATPSAYKNPLGARWTVREVVATYSVKDLRDGFFVDYASYDGTEWTFEVSPEDAQNKLLLRIEDPKPPKPKPELYGKLQLGNVRKFGPFDIPIPLGATVLWSHLGSEVALESNASESEVLDFYSAVLPEYKWVVEKQKGCWSRPFSETLSDSLCVSVTGNNAVTGNNYVTITIDYIPRDRPRFR